jgi:hypothetical protein
MNYKYWATNVLLMGKMKSGKTYNARILLKNVPKENVIALDVHGEYMEYPLRVQPERPYSVNHVNDVIKTAYSYSHKVIVFDDIDLYIHFDRESQQLGDFFVDSRHYELASILVAKRCVSIDKRIFQACDYIFLMRGCLLGDVVRIAEEAGITGVVRESIDEEGHKIKTYKLAFDYQEFVEKSPLNEYPFILVDVQARSYSFKKGLSA